MHACLRNTVPFYRLYGLVVGLDRRTRLAIGLIGARRSFSSATSVIVEAVYSSACRSHQHPAQHPRARPGRTAGVGFRFVSVVDARSHLHPLRAGATRTGRRRYVVLRFRLLECLVICFHARTANDIEGEMEMEKWWRRRTHSLSRLRDFGHCACQDRKGHYVEGGWMSEDGRFFPRLGCNCSACRVCVCHIPCRYGGGRDRVRFRAGKREQDKRRRMAAGHRHEIGQLCQSVNLLAQALVNTSGGARRRR